MAFKTRSTAGRGLPEPEINMVPLIDVMLVLLIIFMVTAPLLVHAVKVDLPKASSQPLKSPPATVVLSVRADGQRYWDLDPITAEELSARLKRAAADTPQPEVHIRADGAAAYREVAALMSMVASAGLSRIGFVTDPSAGVSP